MWRGQGRGPGRTRCVGSSEAPQRGVHLSASRIGEVQSEGWDWYEMDWRQEGVRCGEVALR